MKKSFSLRFVLAIMFCLISAIPGWGAVTEYSNWTQSLSGLTDDASYAWDDYDFKMVVSGQNVHVVWVATRTDGGEKRLNYRHSTDGGKNFGPVQMLATGNDIIFNWEWQGLAVDGDNVHVVYNSGWPSSIKYLRSTDNGANFEPVKIIHSNEYSGYYGIHMAATNGVVTVVLAANHASNAPPYTQDVLCIYSNDGGATFATTTIAHADAGQPPYQYRVDDMIRSGANIYILYSVVDQNWYTTQSHLYLVSSNNGGVTFNPRQRVNVASSNDGYYANSIQNQHYSPNLATVGNNVYVTWVNTEVNNFDNGGSTYTLRFRRSTDKGLTLGDPVTLTPLPVASSKLTGGQETVVASGNNVYVVTTSQDGSGTYLWRSIDSGSSFEDPRKISDGGWWPTVLLDPNDSAKLHIANGYYVTSSDSGASFKGVLSMPPNTLTGWWSPVMAVSNDGVVHHAANRSRYDTSTSLDIYYRRLAPSPAASGPSKALKLVTDSTKRRDNMQIAASPDINLASAMTIEYWVMMDFQGDGNNWSHFQVSVAKKRASGYGSYEMGYWNGFTGFYGRLVTQNSASQYGGDFIGTSIVPQDLNWYHVAMTYDAGAGANNWKYYVNGVLAGSATLTGNIVMDYMPLVLGPDTSGTNGTLQFTDFRVWNRARTAAEIAADMNRTLTGSEPGLNAYYTFSDTTRDMTGRGNNGVLMFKESFVPSTVPLPEDGVCGNSNGGTFTVAPATGLCSSGEESAVTGNGPWNWTCSGSNGGEPANCSANIQAYLVTFASGGNGTLTGNASQTVNYKASATAVTAVPATGYHFVNWTGTGGFVTTTANPLTVTNVTAAKNITANFAINTFSVNFASGGNGTLTGNASQTVNYNASATAVTAVPATGYHFVNWTGTGGFVTTTANPLTVTNVTAAKNITANFAINTFSVNFASGGNGTLTGNASQTVNYKASATAVTAVPATGYHFVNWTGTGGFVPTTANPLTVASVTANQNITANFAFSSIIITKDATKPFAYKGGKGTLNFTAPASVLIDSIKAAISSSKPWITVDYAKIKFAKGKGSVPYTVTENADSAPRSGMITIADDSYAINQAAHPCAIVSAIVNPLTPLPAAGGEQSVTVNVEPDSCQWKVVSYKIPQDSWFSSVGSFPAAGQMLTGDLTLLGTVPANTTIKAKSNVIVIMTADGKSKKSITLKQSNK